MEAKPYNAKDSEEQRMEEPAVSYSSRKVENSIEEEQNQSDMEEPCLSYEAKLAKWEHGSDLLRLISTPSLLDKALAALTAIVKEEKRSPIQFTVEELKQRLEISAERVKNGEKTIPHEEIEKMMQEWIK